MTRSTPNLKIAIQAGPQDIDALQQLAGSSWGAQLLFHEAGVAPLVLADGTLLEIYSPHSACPAYLFKHNTVVVSFKVDDLQQALQMAINQGLTALPHIQGDSLSYCHLALANGTIIGLYQENVTLILIP